MVTLVTPHPQALPIRRSHFSVVPSVSTLVWPPQTPLVACNALTETTCSYFVTVFELKKAGGGGANSSRSCRRAVRSAGYDTNVPTTARAG